MVGRLAIALLGCIAGIAAVCPSRALAAFPGHDGALAVDDNNAFGCTGSCIDGGGPFGSIYAVDPAAGGTKTLSAGGTSFEALPRWSPRGDALTFLAGPTDMYFPGDRYPPTVHVVVTDAAGRARRTVPLPAGLSSLLDPSWTLDGRHLLVVGVRSGGAARDIYRIGLGGSAPGAIAISGPVGARHRVSTPVMSSRGQIAFVQNTTIYVLDRGGRPRRLHGGVDPDFSPGGTRIVFFDPSRDSVDSIGVDGRGVRRLLRLPTGVESPHPVYSPSGRATSRWACWGLSPASVMG